MAIYGELNRQVQLDDSKQLPQFAGGPWNGQLQAPPLTPTALQNGAAIYKCDKHPAYRNNGTKLTFE